MLKQVIVIRTDLKMRKGKMCAQAAHASLMTTDKQWLSMPEREIMDAWFYQDQVIIVVGCGSEQELKALYQQAQEKNLICHMFQDLGYTEFKEPTYTAVAIGPADADEIDKITGHLKLL